MSEETNKKRRFGALTVMIAALALIAVLFVVLAMINNRGRGGQLESIDALRSYLTFDEVQTGSTYALLDGSLVTVSGIEVSVYDPSGEQTLNSQFTAEKPALAVGGSRAVAYDVGGTAYLLVSKNKVVAEDRAIGDIVSATVNEKGYMAICTKEEGYKGAVTVYDPSGTAVYRWSSANGYVYDAVVSPGCKSCAVLCFDQQDESMISRVTVLNIRKEDTLGSYETADNTLIALGYLGKNSLVCIGDSAAVFLDGEGTQKAAYDYADMDLKYFSLEGKDHAVLAFGENSTDMTGTLVSLNGKGKLLGQIRVMGTLKGVWAGGKSTALLAGDSLRMFTDKLAEDGGVENTGGAKAAFPYGNDVILVSNSDVKYYDR